MEDNMIAVEQFCLYYKIDISFIESLNEFGLIKIIPVNESRFLYEHQIKEVEKMMRLHYDLDINMAGIDAISHMLKRIDALQQEISVLKNRL